MSIACCLAAAWCALAPGAWSRYRAERTAHLPSGSVAAARAVASHRSDPPVDVHGDVVSATVDASSRRAARDGADRAVARYVDELAATLSSRAAAETAAANAPRADVTAVDNDLAVVGRAFGGSDPGAAVALSDARIASLAGERAAAVARGDTAAASSYDAAIAHEQQHNFDLRNLRDRMAADLAQRASREAVVDTHTATAARLASLASELRRPNLVRATVDGTHRTVAPWRLVATAVLLLTALALLVPLARRRRAAVPDAGEPVESHDGVVQPIVRRPPPSPIVTGPAIVRSARPASTVIDLRPTVRVENAQPKPAEEREPVEPLIGSRQVRTETRRANTIRFDT